MVLKAVPKPYVSLRDFYREFHYGLHLGIHRNIVTTYDVAFETAGFYVFTQEYAPLGDLTSNVTDTGVGETYSKRVAKQIGAALDYMHSKDIVHRDVKLDNVLIYRSDFTRVKLCDFGESYQAGSLVERRNEWLPYSPPEVLQIKPEGTYNADPSHDVWQFGIVIFVCLTGCLPWQKAASDDPRYVRYTTWHSSMMPIRRTPKLFKLLTSRAQRMFRRFLEPRLERRPKSLVDLTKFLDDRWLAKTAEKDMAEYETDELCPSMYSFHSSPDEKHRLLYTLADCGIETNVDRQSKKNRIKDWIESSVITEEDEEENDDANSASPSSSVSREPVAGHISSIRVHTEKTKNIKSTLKDATQKHFDPRTGALQQGPSEMGVGSNAQRNSSSPSMSNMSTINNGESMAGCLLTFGSHQDLIGSNVQMYNSDLDLHRLGESQSSYDLEQQWDQSLSSNNLVLTYETNSSRSFNRTANPLQRSRSDTVQTVLYASSPAINNVTNVVNETPTNLKTKTNGGGYAPNSSAFFTSNGPVSALKSGYNNTSPFKAKSVTFSGLSNAFQTLAQIPLQSSEASSIIKQNQPPKRYGDPVRTLNANQYMYSEVKDSAYGSKEVSDKLNNPTLNGNINRGSYDKLSGRQQQPYRGSQTQSSLKDTAYDHVAANAGSKKRI